MSAAVFLKTVLNVIYSTPDRHCHILRCTFCATCVLWYLTPQTQPIATSVMDMTNKNAEYFILEMLFVMCKSEHNCRENLHVFMISICICNCNIVISIKYSVIVVGVVVLQQLVVVVAKVSIIAGSN